LEKKPDADSVSYARKNQIVMAIILFDPRLFESAAEGSQDDAMITPPAPLARKLWT
jgi:hypothetical protein